MGTVAAVGRQNRAGGRLVGGAEGDLAGGPGRAGGRLLGGAVGDLAAGPGRGPVNPCEVWAARRYIAENCPAWVAKELQPIFQRWVAIHTSLLTVRNSFHINNLQVPEEGVEPSLPCGNWILSPAHLPFRHSGKCLCSLSLRQSPSLVKGQFTLSAQRVSKGGCSSVLSADRVAVAGKVFLTFPGSMAYPANWYGATECDGPPGDET